MRLNISVPDELATQVRDLGIPVSETCQRALRAAVVAAGARDDVAAGLAAVAERLRGNVSARDLALRAEGRRDGIKWARDYATADDLKGIAGWDGRGRRTVPASLASFARAELRNDVGARMLSVDSSYGMGFLSAAREVWAAVQPLL